MEAANDSVVYLALEGRELLHSARGPPTPTRQAPSSASQGLTLSAESALPLPCGSWQCTAQDATVEPVPGGVGLLRITALLQRADGSWRMATTEYDDGDELNNIDGAFVHSVYHVSGDACCGLGTKGRERRGMPAMDRAACADCALRIMRRSPDRPCCDASTQYDPPPEPAAAQPPGSSADPAPTPERVSWRAGAGAQVLVECESASRATLEEFALDWGHFRLMQEEDMCTVGAIADMQRLATRAIELGEKHQELVQQHQQLAADHRELQRSYQRLAQRSAAVAAVAQRFRVARVLGRGSYGTVLQTVPDHGGPEVIKVPHDDGAAAHESRGARLVLRAFGRAPPPGLEGLVPKAELRLEGRQCMVFPLCGGGNMHTLLQGGKLAPKRVEHYARRLLSGLQALHAARLVHSDVKLENILITSSGQPTLADVGLLRGESECARRSEGGWGTPAYLSPEAEAGPCGCPADMWALGCAVWEMLLGDLTWWSEVLADGVSHSDRAAWAAQRAARAPAPLRALIGGLLRTAPARRLTAAQAAAVLR